MTHILEISKEKTWSARPFQSEDKASLLKLSRLHYGSKELSTEAYVDWLYGGPAGCSFVPVSEEVSSGEIVGFAFHVPLYAKCGDRYGLCYLGCNALVHPDFRHLGIYSGLTSLFKEHIGESLFMYGFPKPNARVPHQKVGKRQVCTLPLLVRPLNISRLASTRFSNPAMRLAVEIGWKVAGNTIWRPTRALAEPWGIQLSQPTSFDEAFDQFWERVADKYDIIIKRDRAFLTWRFCNTSFRTYEILAAKVGGELVGYAVLRSTEIEGVATGLITDLLVEQSDRGEAAGLLLAQQATTRFEEAGMSLAGCLMLPHTHEFAILRQSGFVKAPERFSPQTFQLNAKSLSPELSQEFLAQSSRWFVTMANHDAV